MSAYEYQEKASDTPRTDAVWADKSQNILEHARKLERELATLKAKNIRQRTELRRLNKTLRAMWDGVRFSARVKRDMETPK